MGIGYADENGTSQKGRAFYVAANYNYGIIYMEDTLYQTSIYQSDPSKVDLRSHLATASAAAVFAHAYLVYKDIPVYTDYSEECLAVSERAWNWLNDSANEKNMS